MSAWIKMRTDLADDPAVIAMSGRLMMSEFSVVGVLHAVWSWADQHTTDGHAVGVTGAWLNSRFRCDGLAEAMQAVGWLIIDASGLTLPNFERHNGESAKKRALATERQRRSRASVTPESMPPSRNERDKSVTREDKRRTTPVADATGVPAQRGTRLPDDWQLPKAWGEWALQERPDWTPEDVRRVALAFRNHWVAKAGRDATKRDWSATWQNWVLKEPRPRPGAGPRAGKQADLEARNRAAGDAFEQGGAHAAA